MREARNESVVFSHEEVWQMLNAAVIRLEYWEPKLLHRSREMGESRSASTSVSSSPTSAMASSHTWASARFPLP